MAKQLDHYLWVEKYRPASVKTILLPNRSRKFFESLLNDKQIPNLLLHSTSPGVGKTTIAKAVCRDLDSDMLYINNSMESGIDTLRTNIAKFATVMSFEGKPKIVILDEIDGSSINFQSALRAFLEEFHQSCRFILTCNYISKIIEPLKSRCQIVDFDISSQEDQKEMKPKILTRLKAILKNEKINASESVLNKIIDTFYPDIRSMIKLLDQFSKTLEPNEEITEKIFDIQIVSKDLYDFILDKNFAKAREHIINHNYNYDELYSDFYRNFIPLIDKMKWPKVIICLSEYQYKNGFVPDKELNFAACMLEIMGILLDVTN